MGGHIWDTQLSSGLTQIHLENDPQALQPGVALGFNGGDSSRSTAQQESIDVNLEDDNLCQWKLMHYGNLISLICLHFSSIFHDCRNWIDVHEFGPGSSINAMEIHNWLPWWRSFKREGHPFGRKTTRLTSSVRQKLFVTCWCGKTNNKIGWNWSHGKWWLKMVNSG